jgi:aspartyl-tRNA(Asn)/glutamyl-tRNA(Gln) amidotransferase subunit A
MSVIGRIEALAARIAAENPRLAAVCDVDPDAAPGAGPLAGLAVGVKANIAVRGLPWTAGVAGWAGRVAVADAGVVARLRRAGAAITATLNMHEGALGTTTDNPAFGRCANPIREEFSPGGSSGGSAAAVAAGLCDVALGTDTMGSVRLPAAACGVAGLKPTRGLVGRSGLAMLSPSLDTIGPLAREVRLLWPVLKAMAGPDPADPMMRTPPAGWAAEPLAALEGVQLGVPEGIETACGRVVRAGLERAMFAAGAAGARIRRVPLRGWEPGAARRGGLLLVEVEGAREMAELLDRPGAISEALRALLDYGRALPATRLAAGLARVAEAAAACERALAEVDALLLPTAPQRAVPHGEPPPATQADFTALASFAGVPALALPVWVGQDPLPASVQLVGPAWSERRLIGWGMALEAALDA